MISALKNSKAEKEGRVMEVGAVFLNEASIFIFKTEFFFFKKMSKEVSIYAT